MQKRYKHVRLLKLIEDYRPETIVEFGSWYGKSTIAMALTAKDAGIKNFRIYAVDTWLGSIENWKRESGKNSKKDLLLSQTGRPQFYDRFINNLTLRGVSSYVVPLSMTTDTAWRWLQYKRIEADLVYVDAAHTYEEASADIDRARRILKADTGIACGDDYLHEDGVTKAVHEKIGADNVNLEGTFWWLPPDKGV